MSRVAIFEMKEFSKNTDVAVHLVCVSESGPSLSLEEVGVIEWSPAGWEITGIKVTLGGGCTVNFGEKKFIDLFGGEGMDVIVNAFEWVVDQ